MVAECGLRPSEFWDLSIYDWSLYLHRYTVQRRNQYEKEKVFWSGISIIWSVLMNGLLGLKKLPSDLIKLDDDLKEKKKQEPTEDLLDRVKRRHGTTV